MQKIIKYQDNIVTLIDDTVIDINDIYRYYITENHSKLETLEKFNIKSGAFIKVLNHYGIKKPRLLSYEHNKKTLKTLYGDEHYNNHAQQVQTCLEKYGVENVYQDPTIIEKSKATKLERYGDENFINVEKAKQTCLERYGYTNTNQVPEFKEKKKQTCLEHFGVEYPMQANEVKAKYDFKSVAEKAFKTKKQHGTTNTSKIQVWFVNELKKIYGEANIETEYKEARYPYHCDIYIKSLDQFIELNIYFTHGGHPYNSNSLDDQKALAIWQEKAKQSKFYYNAIRVWTETDPAKQLCAKTNKLNYLMFYTEQEIQNYIDSLKGEYK